MEVCNPYKSNPLQWVVPGGPLIKTLDGSSAYPAQLTSVHHLIHLVTPKICPYAAPLRVGLYGLSLTNHFKPSGLVNSISTHGAHSCTLSIQRFILQLTNMTRGRYTFLEIPPLQTTALLTTGCWKGYVSLGALTEQHSTKCPH